MEEVLNRIRKAETRKEGQRKRSLSLSQIQRSWALELVCTTICSERTGQADKDVTTRDIVFISDDTKRRLSEIKLPKCKAGLGHYPLASNIL